MTPPFDLSRDDSREARERIVSEYLTAAVKRSHDNQSDSCLLDLSVKDSRGNLRVESQVGGCSSSASPSCGTPGGDGSHAEQAQGASDEVPRWTCAYLKWTFKFLFRSRGWRTGGGW